MRHLSLLTSLVAFASVPAPSYAAGFTGPTQGELERVVDGDTLKVRVGVWIDQELVVSVRVAGVGAPELFRPKCPAEKTRARSAKAFVEAFLGDGAVPLADVHRGKYAGRVVARILRWTAATSGARWSARAMR